MQVKDAAFPGLVEKGFRDAAAVIWPGIQKALQSEVVQGSGTAVTIGGHSLGAALATLIAYQAQVRAVLATVMLCSSELCKSEN
jgi:acetyl esterase/lipase